ncbi:Starch-binding associating with outer membrane [Pedobacter steynii]|uniref:Starch-binding associating with outer membrane n=1 Tax=Pedobacter steynii TaxID=430522 RepID=A0A1G9RQ02_9SPHI|nr:SusD/RagB family nutrient-binding outer membrane lipoprotein [Pedobacter steynii]NQX37686.1 SusD/RagB family nutrient-binding outer membrane lipoprotein [Pedobacter steynii]SDM25336.1 Starch-binding associating with outer membrane [Pedobacter steynii]
MKQKTLYIAALWVLLGTSCTKDLEEMNINPNQPTKVEPGPLFTALELRQAGTSVARRSNVGFGMMMVQQTATTKIDDLEGDKYLQSESAALLFNEEYAVPAINMAMLIDMLKQAPEKVNLYAAARIWKVMQMHRLTDAYGDVPYSQAGQGFLQQIYKPAYDKQSDIYADMLKELEQATKALDPAKTTFGAADIIYQGKTEQWKRLGNSLMLRLALRLIKVDPAMAKQWALKAIQGGVMQNNADICYMRHTGPQQELANPIAFDFQKFDLIRAGDIKMGKTFMDYLKATNDPRLEVYSSLPDGNSDPALQKGLPNGYNASTISATPGGGDLSTYSIFNVKTILPLTAPTFFITYAETELMLAEAAARGWTTDQAATHYRAAVEASMDQQKLYGKTISTTATSDYLTTGNPFPTGGSLDLQLKSINEQYWVVTFLNGWESYANWRRTGIPQLIPVNYPGNVTGGTIPRRFTFPRNEYSTNGEHVKQAIAQQGPDTYTTRVWWDK